MKLCVECRFHKADEDKHLCTAILDLVTGEQKDVDCQEARAAPWLCGTEGKLFKYPERAVRPGLQVKGDFDPFGDQPTGRDMKHGRSDD